MTGGPNGSGESSGKLSGDALDADGEDDSKTIDFMKMILHVSGYG